ncbi:UDP-Glycosyltransferase/glycogen phosphorylase [Dendrothele bispora CBS 962.96]|uniref:UDP-Glycosyltransferase/glycogen phosphorylase n=1 Tax=Dendrothele bispora (strain CBS 962.96) TaxID=1314807 RepID=A0A4S8KUY5_DENBC|nr:UDP-Glycosyltransferase/glycogen phosphorylase [Dendrothele bispora CBS 962.96]
MPLMGAFSYSCTGEVVSIPGVPTMYDYEYNPQELTMNASILEEIGRVYISHFDGVLFASAASYEKDAMKTIEGWLGEGDVFPVGPLSTATQEKTTTSSREDLLKVGDGDDASQAKAVEFLDRMEKKFGEKSVIYVSFGSLFWPVEEDKMWATIEEFLANDVPIVFAHPSPFKKPVSEEKLRSLRENPIAIEFPWAPQETILMHPATGWFISHGGWNSTQEAFVYRVPQILWPFAADQPYNSALMSQVHKAAFELINVRTGQYGTQLPYRFKDLAKSEQPKFTVDAVRKEIDDLLVKLKGDEGVVVRNNFEKLATAFLSGWEKKGEARQNLERFLKKYVD